MSLVLANESQQALINTISALKSENERLQKQLSNLLSTKKTIKNKPFDFSKCTFRHVFLRFFYLGWDYRGFAVQDDTEATIEHHIFKALVKTCLIECRSKSNYNRCGRTDKGVSSFGQVISLDIRSRLSDSCHEEIPYCKLLNRVLPDTIRCVAWCPVDGSLSARFSCKGRTYKYFFLEGGLDIGAMRIGAEYLVGLHDFRNFCKMDIRNGVVDYVRRILAVSIEPVNCNCNDLHTLACSTKAYVFTIMGTAFLWHQIRYIVSILLLIGQRKEQPIVIAEMLDVQRNPQRPAYNMVSEIPLNLYKCDYDELSDWNVDVDVINECLNKLHEFWTFSTIKSSMLRCMIADLEQELNVNDRVKRCSSNFLLYKFQPKTYVPLMKRPLCESLSEKVLHCHKKIKEAPQQD